MAKYYLTSILFVICRLVSAQSPEPMVIKPDGTCQLFSDREIGHHDDRCDGLHIIFYDSARTKIQGTYYTIGGKLNGRSSEFDKEGKLRKLINFRDSLEEGIEYVWGAHGKLLRKEYYHEGKLIKRESYK